MKCYTDGSSRANGSPECVAGWSLYIEGDTSDKDMIFYGHLSAPSSNNRGEIFGVLVLCWMLSKKCPNEHISIYTDSQYVTNSINIWRHNWKKKNYAGVKNLDLFMPIFKFWDTNKMSINWVRGHNGNHGNEIADMYCGLGADKDVIVSKEKRIYYMDSDRVLNDIKEGTFR